jgi:hypothetical protein
VYDGDLVPLRPLPIVLVPDFGLILVLVFGTGNQRMFDPGRVERPFFQFDPYSGFPSRSEPDVVTDDLDISPCTIAARSFGPGEVRVEFETVL